MNQPESRMVPLLRAHPHHWGSGLIHQIDPERDQTLCGKSPGGCPGTAFQGISGQITCKLCLKSIAAKARQKETMERWAQSERERERERAASQREWRSRYDAYLLSTEWREKRRRVMRRANGMCEGCGEQGATEVHHLKYPRNCFPGSPEWIAREKLFDLRAICRSCHSDVHPEEDEG